MNWLPFSIWFVIITLIFQSVIWTNYGENEINKVPCYDKTGNEIIGLTCVEKIHKINSLPLVLFASFTFQLLIFIIGFCLYGGHSQDF
jgi:hypothetical protein